MFNFTIRSTIIIGNENNSHQMGRRSPNISFSPLTVNSSAYKIVFALKWVDKDEENGEYNEEKGGGRSVMSKIWNISTPEFFS